MSLRIKICGINSVESAAAALSAGADFAGLVFHPHSPRRVDGGHARMLANAMRGRLQLVALFANPRDQDITGAIAAANPDFIQLHGAETPARVAEVRAHFGKPVIKAIAIAQESDLAGIAAYEDAADMLLFDAKAPERAMREGGHGAAFDWRLLRGRRIGKPWLLAGGLTAENVVRAIRAADAPGVDVSSGVESAPGVKDPNLIRVFAAKARAATLAGAAP